MNQLETETLRDVLDDARRLLTNPSFRSRNVSFTAWSITAKVLPSQRDGEWSIQENDRRKMYCIRKADEDDTLVVYEDFVSYRPVSNESRRLASLWSTPVSMQADNRTLKRSGPKVQNRELISLLEKQGAVIDIEATDDPVSAAGHWDVKLEGPPRAGQRQAVSERLAEYVDHHAHPSILLHPLLQFFVGHRRQGAVPEPILLDTSLFPASEVPTKVGPSERRPTADEAKPGLPSLDPDQMAARDLAMAMQPILVNGPPGTGKSQTIASIVEECLARGRRVVVTSTEKSAIDVARRRLAARNIVAASDVFIGSPQDLALVSPEEIGKPDFDLAIIDEASRMPMNLALTVLVRAKSVVIIGDEMQMRPEKDGQTILDVAHDIALPSVTLSYHYRSQERSLISVSNILAYGMSLRTVPSPKLAPEDGLKIIEMNGAKTTTNDAGGKTNLVEAEAIVRWVIERGSQAGRSIGILAANRSQKNVIENLIKQSLPRHIQLKIGADKHEPMFVRLIDQAQGEERDSILISTVYGDEANGQFGMFDRKGAVNRINVMLSRARYETRLYTSIGGTRLAQNERRPGLVALKAVLAIINTSIGAETRHASPPSIRNIARRLSMRVDNLGVVYGLRYTDDREYRVGVVLNEGARTVDQSDAIVRQLQAVGWKTFVVDDRRLVSDPTGVTREIGTAVNQSPRG